MSGNRFPAYLEHMQQAASPWRGMRGMRNRIAHGYFDINLDVVWDTVQLAFPDKLKQLPALQQDASPYGGDSGETRP